MDEGIVRLQVRRQQLRNICNWRDAAFALAALTDEGCGRVFAEAEAGRMLDREGRGRPAGRAASRASAPRRAQTGSVQTRTMRSPVGWAWKRL